MGLPRQWLWSFLCLWTTSVEGQTFSDDFESGTFLTTEAPQGKWTRRNNPFPASTFALMPEAAHRGALGLRMVDDTGGAGSGIGNTIRVDFPFLITGSLHVRFWLRLVSDNGLGSMLFASVDGDPLDLGITEAYHDSLDQEWSLGGRDRVPTFAQTHTSPGLQPNPWHLVEVVLTNVGAMNGSRALWVDGVQRLLTENVDWTGISVKDVVLGQSWGERSWQGTLDFDDVRMGPTSPASRLRVDASRAEQPVLSCVPVQVELLEGTRDELAPAPEPLTLSLQASGGTGTFHLDSGCLGPPVSTLDMPQASQTERAYFQPGSAGTLTLTALHQDLLPGTASLTVSAADGEDPTMPNEGPLLPDARHLTVACGCNTDPSAANLTWPLLLLTLLASRFATKPEGCRGGRSGLRHKQAFPPVLQGEKRSMLKVWQAFFSHS